MNVWVIRVKIKAIARIESMVTNVPVWLVLQDQYAKQVIETFSGITSFVDSNWFLANRDQSFLI